MSDNIKVSVVVATYNQEKYIAQALDSIVTQKVNFKMEVLVGDDCSSDNTADIVRRYSELYPNIVIPIIREKNLGMSANAADLTARCRGEYIAMLEGDDFWTTDNKLQMQADFLDNNKDYVAVYGQCMLVNEEGVRMPEWEQYTGFSKGGEYTTNLFEQYVLPGQTGTSMYRRDVNAKIMELIKNKGIDYSEMIDRDGALCMMAVGKIYTMDEMLSAYRYVLDPSSGSWSSKNDYFSTSNVLAYLGGLKHMESMGKCLNVPINFDERRKHEFNKISEKKGELPEKDIKQVRKKILMDYNNKFELIIYLIKRQLKK